MKSILKRTLLLFLSLLLVAGTVPALAAATEGNELVLQNPGFEDATETENPGWSYMPAANEIGAITVDTKMAQSGKKSLCIHNTQNNDPWASQYITEGFKKGAMYTVSAWLSTDLISPGGRGVGFKIEQYDAAGEYLMDGAFESSKFNINTLGQWEQFEMAFQVLENAEKLKVYCRSYTPGFVWYDDVRVSLSGGPEPYSFYADHVFHYPDEESGKATITLHSYYSAKDPEATDVSGRFTFYDTDGTTVLDKKEGVKFADGKIEYVYPVSIMKEKQKKYVLKTELLDKEGTVIRDWSENFYVYDRPNWMPNGRCVINGKRFDPVIAYHASYQKSYEQIASAGFNVVQTGSGAAAFAAQRTETLKALQKNNMKALFCLYPDMLPAGHPDYIENTRTLVAQYKDDPTIWAWAVMDEPLGNGAGRNAVAEWKQWLEDSYTAIRDIDPNHPVYIVDCNKHAESIKYCDVFVADCYCQGDSAQYVSYIIDPLTEAHTRIPTYELASCFKYNGQFPPTATARGSVYRGFEAGNSYGTGFYAIDEAIGHDAGDETIALYDLDVWPEYNTLIKEELPILFDYYAGEDSIVFNRHREGEATKELWWDTWFNAKGEMYLMAHNRSSAAAEFDIPLVSANGKIRIGSYTAEPIGLTKTGQQKGKNNIKLALPKEGIALYKITPAEKVDLTNIDAPTFSDMEGDYAWAADAVSELDGRGIINQKGEGLFAPADAITRGDFAMFLIRTLGFTADAAENFADVPAESEYAKEIAVGRALGIIKGVGENYFSPEAPITRQDMMTICARGMKMAEKLGKADESILNSFLDGANVADYAKESVSAMVASGIIKGDDAGYLNPTGNTRRAEAAVIMQRILNAKHVDAETGTEEDDEEPVEEDEVIDLGAVSDTDMARYTRAVELLKGLGTPDIKAEASITNGAAEKALAAILGMEYNALGEDTKALKTQDAVEALVKLLGYEVYAARDGSLMATASRIDLLRGVDVSKEYMRGGELAVLLENALGIHCLDPAEYGEGANGSYVESEDTLLTRYRHLTLYKGLLEQNEYTGLPKEQVAIGTNLLKAGETDAASFIGQRVEAYTENEDSRIVYIRANKNTKVTVIDTKDIVLGETTASRMVWENENGKTESRTISGASLIYNGKYKTGWTLGDVTPDMGTITLIENTSANVSCIIVDAYNNYVVDSVWTDDCEIRFKNRDVLVWDYKDSSLRLSMEGANWNALKEWDVMSLYESEDGTVKKAKISRNTVKGIATEISRDNVTIGDTTYKVAADPFGTPVLSEERVYMIDAMGKLAGINDASVRPNYVYLTSIAKKKGIDAKVQARVYTKDNEMKIMTIKDTLAYNGISTSALSLLDKTELIRDGIPQGQLIIMETQGEGDNEIITGIETAKDGSVMGEAQRQATFSYDAKTEQDASLANYQGYQTCVLGFQWFIDDGIVWYVVPENYSDDAANYHAYGFGDFKHDMHFYDCVLYDVDENRSVGALVQTQAVKADVSNTGTTGVIEKIGKAVNDDGEQVITVTVTGEADAKLTFPEEDFKIGFGADVLTSIANGETKYHKNKKGTYEMDEYIAPSDLHVGDIVMYNLRTGSATMVSGMRVLCRYGSTKRGEYSVDGVGTVWVYSELVYSYGPVVKKLERGIVTKPVDYERLYGFRGNGVEAPTILVEGDKVKRVTPDHIQEGDMVYAQKYRPWQTITVIYR